MTKSGVERIGRTVPLARAKRQCLDKKFYWSKNKARDSAARYKAKGWAVQEPYRCTLCGRWHLATVKPAQKSA